MVAVHSVSTLAWTKVEYDQDQELDSENSYPAGSVSSSTAAGKNYGSMNVDSDIVVLAKVGGRKGKQASKKGAVGAAVDGRVEHIIPKPRHEHVCVPYPPKEALLIMWGGHYCIYTDAYLFYPKTGKCEPFEFSFNRGDCADRVAATTVASTFDPETGVSYFFGGFQEFNGGMFCNNKLWKFDPNTSTVLNMYHIEAGFPLPLQRHASTLTFIPSFVNSKGVHQPSRLFLFGGLDVDSRVMYDAWFFHLDSGIWEQVTSKISGTYPRPREAHSATFWTPNADIRDDPSAGEITKGPRVVIFGGYTQPRDDTDEKNGCRLNEVVELDLERMAWVYPSVHGSVPSARSIHSACLDKNTMVVYGGWDAEPNFPVPAKESDNPAVRKKRWTCSTGIYLYHIPTSTWDILPVEGNAQPLGSAGHTCFVFGGKMFKFGGNLGPSSHPKANNFVATDEFWSVDISVPPPLKSLTCEIIKNQEMLIIWEDVFTEEQYPDRMYRIRLTSPDAELVEYEGNARSFLAKRLTKGATYEVSAQVVNTFGSSEPLTKSVIVSCPREANITDMKWHNLDNEALLSWSGESVSSIKVKFSFSSTLMSTSNPKKPLMLPPKKRKAVNLPRESEVWCDLEGGFIEIMDVPVESFLNEDRPSSMITLPYSKLLEIAQKASNPPDAKLQAEESLSADASTIDDTEMKPVEHISLSWPPPNDIICCVQVKLCVQQEGEAETFIVSDPICVNLLQRKLRASMNDDGQSFDPFSSCVPEYQCLIQTDGKPSKLIESPSQYKRRILSNGLDTDPVTPTGIRLNDPSSPWYLNLKYGDHILMYSDETKYWEGYYNARFIWYEQRKNGLYAYVHYCEFEASYDEPVYVEDERTASRKLHRLGTVDASLIKSPAGESEELRKFSLAPENADVWWKLKSDKEKMIAQKGYFLVKRKC